MIDPVDVLLDRIEQLERDKLPLEQFVERHNDPADAPHVRRALDQIKRIRTDIRALKAGINVLQGAPHTTLHNTDDPHDDAPTPGCTFTYATGKQCVYRDGHPGRHMSAT